MVKEEDTMNQNVVNTHDDDDDDEEEEDEDYVPPTKGDDEEEEDAIQTTTTTNTSTSTTTLSLEQQKAVDDAFESLFGTNNNTNEMKQPTKKKKNKIKSNKKQVRLLADIFGGKNIAQQIILSKQQSFPKKDSKLKKKRTFTDSCTQPIMIQMEEKIFAGQTIQIQTTTTTTTTNTSKVDTTNTNTNKKKKSGIDSVLEQFQQPTKINTLMKTSSDWDTFKDQNQLKEDIEEKAQGKNAYLIKQDFLTRVDHRRFEMEKNQRNKQRATTTNQK